MGSTWKTTATLILSLLPIPALTGVKTPVAGVEGQRFDIRCDYPDDQQSNAKFFCHVQDNTCSNKLIRTQIQNQWVKQGRYSMFDNTTGAFFTVSVDKLTLEDSGIYWCGVDIRSFPDHIDVVQLTVSQATVAPTTVHPMSFNVDRLNLPLYLTAVMCVSAILCVCMFTLCLLLAVKQRRSNTHRNRQTSTDYETMTPGVGPQPEWSCNCSDPDCPDASFLSPPPPPDLCSHFTAKQQESLVTFDMGEYADADLSGHISQYQHLDLKQLDEHVYHCLHGSNSTKDGPLGVK